MIYLRRYESNTTVNRLATIATSTRRTAKGAVRSKRTSTRRDASSSPTLVHTCYACHDSTEPQVCLVHERVQKCYSKCEAQLCAHHSLNACIACKEFYPHHDKKGRRFLRCKRCENANLRFRKRRDFHLHKSWYEQKWGKWSYCELNQYKKEYEKKKLAEKEMLKSPPQSTTKTNTPHGAFSAPPTPDPSSFSNTQDDILHDYKIEQYPPTIQLNTLPELKEFAQTVNMSDCTVIEEKPMYTFGLPILDYTTSTTSSQPLQTHGRRKSRLVSRHSADASLLAKRERPFGFTPRAKSEPFGSPQPDLKRPMIDTMLQASVNLDEFQLSNYKSTDNMTSTVASAIPQYSPELQSSQSVDSQPVVDQLIQDFFQPQETIDDSRFLDWLTPLQTPSIPPQDVQQMPLYGLEMGTNTTKPNTEKKNNTLMQWPDQMYGTKHG